MRTGTTSNEIRDYEIRHAEVARRAATEGIVLLRNEGNILPLKEGARIALFGAGAGKTIKGGTGSGDVNERHVVTIYEGLLEAGFDITTEDWILEYDRQYIKAKEAWRDLIWEKSDRQGGDGMALTMAYFETPFSIPVGPEIKPSDTDTAIYVLSRIAGEGADRSLEGNDYYLNAEEEKQIDDLCHMYENVIILINAGGVVDLGFTDRHENIKGILCISQPGQEGGRAVADILLGKVNPSGRLTDTWPLKYSDIPFSDTYSHLNGDLEKEYYREGIYTGYRYFDTFDVPVRYPFGFGLSYTDFEHKVEKISIDGETVRICVNVRNAGSDLSGREVVQIYVSCPQEGLPKECRRLAGFEKTKLLAPGERETVTVAFSIKDLASYSQEIPGWILEGGAYGIFEGKNISDSCLCGSVVVPNTVTTLKTRNILPLSDEMDELKDIEGKAAKKRLEWAEILKDLPSVTASEIITEEVSYEEEEHYSDPETEVFVDSLSKEQLIQLATGDTGNNQNAGNLGAAGIMVPGSAAQTSDCAGEEGLGIIILADGPAGLRLNREYFVENGEVIARSIEALEGGFLYRGDKTEPGIKYYQYCTSFPVGTMLAQSWDREIVSEVGRAVAEEMREFNVSLWLAPGMNIHRNPLCGRNFEYYSEDPLLSGKTAAAMTKGVQETEGCGVTIKHFALNNQEDNRMHVDCVVSERAAREIYLKGFEVAVRESHPASIMTSYNLINGIHAANNKDICTYAARCEWGFDGLIMTDWTTTLNDPSCTASGCMRAGNDIVMPGFASDHDNLREELENGSLEMKDLKRCVANVVKTVRKLTV